MNPSESIESTYSELRRQSELPFKFFFAFARFEYALKSAGFIRNTGSGVSADWDKFAGCCPDLTSVNDPNLKISVDYLFNDPPKKQVYDGGALQFVTVPPTQRSNQQLCVLLRRIRNNLFHGAKFPYDSQRDGELISAALRVLDALLSCNTKIQQWFE